MGCHTLTSCIDEDLSKCGKNYEIDYHVVLTTNIQLVLQQTLDEIKERSIREALEKELEHVFSNVAHDVDLNFYADNLPAYHENHIINDDHSSFTIYLRPDNYEHVSFANDKEEPLVNIVGNENLNSLELRQVEGDTLPSQQHALFAARRAMLVDDRQESYDVTLHMQNSCFALVIDDREFQPEEVKTYARGFATGFAPADSTFRFARPFTVSTKSVTSGGFHAFYATTFPSRNETEMAALRQTIETDDDESAYWTMEVQVKMKGKYTKTTLRVNRPLRAWTANHQRLFARGRRHLDHRYAGGRERGTRLETRRRPRCGNLIFKHSLCIA